MIINKKAPRFKGFDLGLWIIIVILYSYDFFVNKKITSEVWLISGILLLISVLIKLIYLARNKKE